MINKYYTGVDNSSTPDDYEYMRLGHQFTEWDDGNISGGSKNYFFVGAAARYVCSGDVFS